MAQEAPVCIFRFGNKNFACNFVRLQWFFCLNKLDALYYLNKTSYTLITIALSINLAKKNNLDNLQQMINFKKETKRQFRFGAEEERLQLKQDKNFTHFV